ncbi:hypothetical protein HanRHA438_Chr06g0248931 [Helianthus annuus]|nr:hypothetical protein HanRHA438_Chr06g0248931 [Helianthus annuus]
MREHLWKGFKLGGRMEIKKPKICTFHGIIFFLMNNNVVAKETMTILHEQ